MEGERDSQDIFLYRRKVKFSTPVRQGMGGLLR